MQRFCRLPQGNLHRLRAAVRLDGNALRLNLRVVLRAENNFVFSVRIRLERQNIFAFRQIKRWADADFAICVVELFPEGKTPVAEGQTVLQIPPFRMLGQKAASPDDDQRKNQNRLSPSFHLNSSFQVLFLFLAPLHAFFASLFEKRGCGKGSPLNNQYAFAK